MPTLVIKSFPEELHAKLQEVAAAHRRSVTQETIYLLEIALSARVNESSETPDNPPRWAKRRLLPEYEALLNSGALNSGTDSASGLSEERDAR